MKIIRQPTNKKSLDRKSGENEEVEKGWRRSWEGLKKRLRGVGEEVERGLRRGEGEKREEANAQHDVFLWFYILINYISSPMTHFCPFRKIYRGVFCFKRGFWLICGCLELLGAQISEIYKVLEGEIENCRLGRKTVQNVHCVTYQKL